MTTSFDPSTVQESLEDRAEQFTRIKDCIEGSDAIKGKGVTYLPKPDPDNTSDANNQRYLDYIERAVFYNIAQKTKKGLLGLAFTRNEPKFEVPPKFQYFLESINGSGLPLSQQVKQTAGEVIELGRAGLFVDYSKEKSESYADILSGKVRASILLYTALDIIWVETTLSNSEELLRLVILKESYQQESENGYTTESAVQYRILILRDGVYNQEIWRSPEDNSAGWALYESYIPTKSDGSVFDRLPFVFVGAENNNTSFDSPPLLTITDLNIAHYRNSADAEESSFIHGQPTFVVSGLTQTWLDTVLKGAITVGSRGGVPLPEGASASLLHVEGNLLPAEGMREKEKQMTAIGAMIVTEAYTARTATEINRDSSVENSELSTIMANVENAYEQCFLFVSEFMGQEGFTIELPTSFSSLDFEPQTYMALVNGTMQGHNTNQVIFNYLKNSNMLEQDKDYDEWVNEIADAVPSGYGLEDEEA